MRGSSGASNTLMKRALDTVERVGNAVPQPAVLFSLLIGILVVLSQALQWLGVSATYLRINPQTHGVDEVTTKVQGLLSAEGIRFICTSAVANFMNFGPVGIILVAMIGIGVAERSGLIEALVRKIVQIAPPRTMTAIIVTIGVVSSIAADAGYLVLIPLGASAFYSLGRHPLVGLAAAFAGVAAAFGANFLVKPIDVILTEMTNDAIQVVDPARSVDVTANFYFGIVSSIVLIAVCTIITDWVIEPRLGKYQQESPSKKEQGLSGEEMRGLLYALFTGICVLVLLGLATLLPGAPLRHPTTGQIIGDSPLMASLVFIIMVLFLVTGTAYGIGARTITTIDQGIAMANKTIADLGGLLVLLFVVAQFVAYFNFTGIGTILASKLAGILQEANLGHTALLLSFIVIGFLLSFPFPAILPKWAIMAPVFVPLFLRLGVEPDALLAAYRVSDAPPNVINPLLAHLALVVGFAQRWQSDAGVGTIIAMMLPYAVATFVAWAALFFAWFLLGVPFGP